MEARMNGGENSSPWYIAWKICDDLDLSPDDYKEKIHNMICKCFNII
jgi:hypothetical protein